MKSWQVSDWKNPLPGIRWEYSRKFCGKTCSLAGQRDRIGRGSSPSQAVHRGAGASIKMGEALPFRELSRALADVGIPADRILNEGERDLFFVSLLSDPDRSPCAIHPPRFRHDEPRSAPRFHEDCAAYGGAEHLQSHPYTSLSFHATLLTYSRRARAPFPAYSLCTCSDHPFRAASITFVAVDCCRPRLCPRPHPRPRLRPRPPSSSSSSVRSMNRQPSWEMSRLAIVD